MLLQGDDFVTECVVSPKLTTFSDRYQFILVIIKCD